jgi:hypothetical protein
MDQFYPEEQRIEELEKSLVQGAPEDDGNTADVATPASGAETAHESALPTSSDEGQPPAAQPDSPAEHPAASAQDDPNGEAWRHKYEVLQGKINSEGPRNAETIRQLKAEIEALKAQVQPAPAQAQVAQAPTNEDEATLIQGLVERTGWDPEDVRLLLDAAATKAGQKADEKIAPLRQTFEQQQAGEVKRLTAEFWQAVDEAVPGWEQLQADPGFQAYQSRLRINLLAMQQQLDHEGVINAFQTFQQLEQTKQPAPVAPAAAPPVKAPDASEAQRRAMAAQVMPRPAGAATDTGASPKTYTLANYNALKARLSAGAFAGDPKAEQALEDELDNAWFSKRVIGA